MESYIPYGLLVAVLLVIEIPRYDCSLTCLSGMDVAQSANMSTVRRCANGEVCFLDKYITADGRLRWNAGCRNKLQCGTASSNAGMIVCTVCCDKNLCAGSLCGLTLFSTQHGPICYNCDQPVDHPDSCDTMHACNKDEFCGVNQLSTGKYDIGCRSSQGRNVCAESHVKYLCNSTCSLCVGMTSAPMTQVAQVTLHNDPCIRNPCQHGTCNSYPAGGFHCDCATGYTGSICDTVLTIRDCKDVKDMNIPNPNNDAVYLIDVGNTKLNVKCDMQTDGGGWTILLNRETGIVDFGNKDSTDYAIGFGDVRGDYWMGLEGMHSITSDGRRYQLRVEMTDEHGSLFYEVYDDFSVGPGQAFTLHVGNYFGTAGVLIHVLCREENSPFNREGDSLSGHNGFGFTTSDKDQDSNPINCANDMQGGWWFHSCFDSCLTCPFVKPPGTYQCRSMSWNSHMYCIALNTARMLVRPM